MTTTVTTATSTGETCSLDIGGMTCASCVRHVEKALKRVDGGVTAEVNLATEVATVTFDPVAVELGQLTAAVASAGYTATPRSDGGSSAAADVAPSPETGDGDRDRHLRDLKRKWQVSLTVGLGLMVLMYLPLNLDTMDWLMPVIFVVTSVIQFWAGRSSTPRRGRARATARRT